MANQESIRLFSGQVIGWVETESNGDKIYKNFAGQVLGYYRKSRNVTTDWYGRVTSYGDTGVVFIFKDSGNI